MTRFPYRPARTHRPRDPSEIPAYIERLHAVAAKLAMDPDEVARDVGFALARYLDMAPETTIEAELGLEARQGHQPWWQIADKAAQAVAVRWQLATLVPNHASMSPYQQAVALHDALRSNGYDNTPSAKTLERLLKQSTD
ncbi:MAG: hypothetical protein KJ904_00010 [Alphaproteobacteria bacterium]|uniref:Uncharacterized protein n=1 Tax=viral metagenome TaxID=1070528 RepID=A0A6M3M109_9ZZZZ|nr:hypothetical protein [Alphaproteobacteria bacterium]MBU0798644.1 hypothetical protein [Alphaproteobacteria bacterium]MBU0885526.1 hypothetical protein [Alphaproteobacteria bacterium]MBU1811896.1 hypothetical protein [Alphaproteobacteria bacterium]MBU2090456.1 hypothetical protein [Alphaproteobacteria bacterium]